jgi:serine phosphatase RsbU (regulator of sigma subunit)/anti-sigma regulatory factor (Ser/Thr protein kinase)
VSDDSAFAARAHLAPEPTAVAQARTFIKDTLRNFVQSGAALPETAVGDAVLLVSELVANALQHAGTGFEVGCRLTGRGSATLEVTVTDRHPARSLPDPPPIEDSSSERGRGLILAAALASAWGVTYTATAKTVWFRLLLSSPGAEAASIGADPVSEVDVPDGVAVASWHAGKELGTMYFDELVRHTVEAARDAVGADAAYALVADEEGELQVRGTVGVAAPDALTAPLGTIVLSDGAMARSQISVPFLVDGRVTGVLGAGAAAPGTFRALDEWRLQQVADRVAMSLERLRLAELERVRRGRVAFLAEASELLSSTLDQRQAVALTAQLMVPRLAAWCAVFLADSPGDLKLAYVWHEDEARMDDLSQLLGEIGPPPAGTAGAGTAVTGQSWSLAVPPGAGPAVVRMAADSAWWFPLTARGRGLGMAVIGRPRDDRRWQDPPPRESLELAEDLTRRAGLALDNARLYERQRRTSQALQQSLLPPELPAIPRAELAAEYAAAGEASEVGGDFYDVFAVGGSRWRFAIGDVCGTGPQAAAVTGLARHTLRILAAEGHPIADVVRRLNDLLLAEWTAGWFVTLLHGEICVPPSGPLEVSLVCAGHPPPLLLRAAADAGHAAGSAARGSGLPGEPCLPEPAAEPQLLLGVQDDCSFAAEHVRLFPGDLLLCVTDGVTDRRDDQGRLLDDADGLARLLAGCRGLRAKSVAFRVRQAVSDFGSAPQSDDMAVLVIRAAGDPGEPSSAAPAAPATPPDGGAR